MIVVSDSPGQLGNRLWSFAPLVARALEERRRLVIPFFGEYAHLFEDLGSVSRIHFICAHGAGYERLALKCIHLFHRMPVRVRERLRIHVDGLAIEREQEELIWRPWSLSFIRSWKRNSGPDRCLAYRAELRHLFHPAHAFAKQAEAIIAVERLKHDVIIGVHLRQGDYRHFRKGVYWYSMEQYAVHMMALHDEYARQGRSTGFLICSNEALDLTAFSGLHTFHIPHAQSIEDLHALSLCDLIIGPPSTFSMWASFYGAVPLHFLLPSASPATIADHKVIVAQDRFADGSIVVHASDPA